MYAPLSCPGCPLSRTKKNEEVKGESTMNKEQALACIKQLYRYCEKEEIHLKPIIQGCYECPSWDIEDILDLLTDEIKETAQ